MGIRSGSTITTTSMIRTVSTSEITNPGIGTNRIMHTSMRMTTNMRISTTRSMTTSTGSRTGTPWSKHSKMDGGMGSRTG
jgi:hypothetical protein